ncbi:MAG: hypothetical protein OXG88_01165 [Gammaproteobacteria bacterium]|nr:hypothetical protein [Gammaproteobacteria bacterium]
MEWYRNVIDIVLENQCHRRLQKILTILTTTEKFLVHIYRRGVSCDDAKVLASWANRKRVSTWLRKFGYLRNFGGEVSECLADEMIARELRIVILRVSFVLEDETTRAVKILGSIVREMRELRGCFRSAGFLRSERLLYEQPASKNTNTKSDEKNVGANVSKFRQPNK